jgi:hypothetical protein
MPPDHSALCSAGWSVQTTSRQPSERLWRLLDEHTYVTLYFTSRLILPCSSFLQDGVYRERRANGQSGLGGGVGVVDDVDAPCDGLVIPILMGAEPVTGSTRMRAGTVTKLALNAISTGAMVRLGKTVDSASTVLF